jgi:hypothetical protein
MTKLSIVISHHLSDIQTGNLSRLDVHNRCNFIKWLTILNKDLRAEIDADAKWDEFTKSRFFVK